MKRPLSALVVAGLAGLPALAQPVSIAGKPYSRLASRQETRDAFMRQLVGFTAEWGPWHVAAPFPHPGGGNDTTTPFAPETLLPSMAAGGAGPDFSKPIALPDGSSLPWREVQERPDIGGLGGVLPIDLREGVPKAKWNNGAAYLHRSIVVDQPTQLPVTLGADDGVKVWLNGVAVVDAPGEHPLDPGANQVTLDLKPGVNHLLVKVTQTGGEWQFAMAPRIDLDPAAEAALDYQLDTDFPDDESRHYRLVTIPVPRGVEAEVGGIDVLPGEGRPILCTRRGEVWIVDHAYSPPTSSGTHAHWKRFASGLQEPLGVAVRPDKTSGTGYAVYTAQRAELTRLIDDTGDDIADRFETVCDRWSISGNYHEYAFGPKFDRDGNAWVTLNLAHTGGETVMGATVPTRGWAVRIDPAGAMHKVADGLRSPDGIGMFTDGQMFYTDNQGDFIATCKLSPLFDGSFHGHQASLAYRDGWAHWKAEGKAVPDRTPAAVWFPYQKMGQSASDILADTSRGKFGPFDGQLFVGDQTHATVMRVCLEKIPDEKGNPVYQGACFPFKRGFLSGVHRMCWGADGSMLVGMTDRGWGSVGPKRFGLQRLVYTGVEPFEIRTISAAPDGFVLDFTRPWSNSSAESPASYTLKSYTYLYHPDYGSPEVESHDRVISAVQKLSDRAVKLVVDQMKPGFVYEFDAAGVRDSADATRGLLHAKAYFTLNVVPRK
jgi:hypothetical protein